MPQIISNYSQVNRLPGRSAYVPGAPSVSDASKFTVHHIQSGGGDGANYSPVFVGLGTTGVDVRGSETIDITTGPVANLNTCGVWKFYGVHAAGDVDTFLANLSATAKTNGSVNFPNSTRTSASDAAVSTLQAAGWTITTA